MIQAVLFDMDGLLFDSERVGAEMILAAVARQGLHLDMATLIKTLGVTDAVAKDIVKTAVPGVDIEKVWSEYASGMFALAKEGGMPLKTGARELLAALKERNIPAAVASSNSEYAVRLYLDNAHITDFFAAVVTRDAGLPSKPAPELFLRAAEEVRVAPKNCLVLEDSMNGIKSGRAAGMMVCMVPDLIPYSDACEPYADIVMKTLADVILLLPE